VELEEIMSAFREFVKTNYEVADDDSDFNDDVHLFDYGYVDSFGAVEMHVFTEQEFGVKVSDQDLILHPLNTIREISTFIYNRLQGNVMP
jgi:methoxymalonate biosynthesis acyl carrier protein